MPYTTLKNAGATLIADRLEPIKNIRCFARLQVAKQRAGLNEFLWLQILHEMIVSVIQFAVQRQIVTGLKCTVCTLAHLVLTISTFLSSSWNSEVKRRTSQVPIPSREMGLRE